MGVRYSAHPAHPRNVLFVCRKYAPTPRGFVLQERNAPPFNEACSLHRLAAARLILSPKPRRLISNFEHLTCGTCHFIRVDIFFTSLHPSTTQYALRTNEYCSFLLCLLLALSAGPSLFLPLFLFLQTTPPPPPPPPHLTHISPKPRSARPRLRCRRRAARTPPLPSPDSFASAALRAPASPRGSSC